MKLKTLLLCAAMVPMFASCTKEETKDNGLTFEVGDTFNFVCSGDNLKEGSPSVFSFLQDEGFTEGFLAVRNKTDVFNAIIEDCESIVILSHDEANGRYEFTFGKDEFQEPSGVIRKDGTFGNDEGEGDHSNHGFGSATYHDPERSYSSGISLTKFDKAAMKVYFEYQVTKNFVGSPKTRYADELVIDIVKA